MDVLQRGRANDDAGPAAKRRHKGDGESAAANGVAAEDPMMADFAVCDWLLRATMLTTMLTCSCEQLTSAAASAAAHLLHAGCKISSAWPSFLTCSVQVGADGQPQYQLNVAQCQVLLRNKVCGNPT
jgi:hypothetical protein